MLTLEQAQAQMLDGVRPVAGVETIPLFESLGRVLAADVVSTVDVPPLDNSAMDGYALRSADLTADPAAVLPVSQRIPAGHVGQPLQPGTAARIFTGAPVPPGADAVVMQEHCDAGDAGVAVRQPVKPGQNIRLRGEDVKLGALVLPLGTAITPAAMGLIASAGLPQVQVRRRLHVALLSSGDELVAPGQPLPPGAIYNSNRYMLRGLIEASGAVCTDFGIVADRLDATRDALRRAADGQDLVLTTGGVSVGEEDHLKAAVRAEGALDLWQVAIKPGKPLAFGRIRGEGGETLFVGLPGNPVAAFVTFLLAVRPLLARLSGAPLPPTPHAARLRAEFDWPRPDPKRREFLRARRAASGGVEIHPNQNSGVLTSVAWAEGLVDLAPGQVVQRGDPVPFLPYAEIWG